MKYNGFILWIIVINVQEILLCMGTQWPFRMGINIPTFSRVRVRVRMRVRGKETEAQTR